MTVAGDRGQVVLLAAVVVAVALVAMSTAYHGLGYHGDVRTTAAVGAEEPTTVAEHRLQAAVDATAVDTARPWMARNTTVSDVRDAVREVIADLQRSDATRGQVFVVRENEALADAWADDDCPGGTLRDFGPCRADGGVVVQERANETVLVGVVVDLTIRSKRGETRATLRLAAR